MALKEFLNLLYLVASFMTSSDTIFIYGLSLLLIYVWYKQKGLIEGKKYGYNINVHPFRAAIASTLEGYFGALVFTFIIVMLGVVVTENSIYMVIGISLLASIIFRSYNFLNIIYACSIVAIFTNSDKHIYSLMVVGIVLIFIRGLLILISWSRDYIAFIVRNDKNETFGGYSVNKIWPVYAGAIIMIHAAAGDTIKTPDWWPIFTLSGMKGMVLCLSSIMLFVGNSRNVYSTTKNSIIVKSSIVYMSYGAIFLALAWLCKKNGIMGIAFAVLAIVAYAILEIALNDKVTSKYKIFFSKDKLTILDVVPSSAAFYARIKPLDKIVSINGIKDSNIEILNRIIRFNRHLELVIEREGESINIDINIETMDDASTSSLPANLYELGIIAVPPNIKKDIANLPKNDMGDNDERI